MEQSRLSYPDCVLLKKLGYKGETNGYYIGKIPVVPSSTQSWNEKGSQFVAMPTSHQAIEFLFKRKGAVVLMSHDVDNEQKIVFKPIICMTRNRRIVYKYELESFESLETAYADAVKQVLKSFSSM